MTASRKDTHLVLARLVHPRQDSPQYPLSVSVLLKGNLIPRLSSAYIKFPLALQRLECANQPRQHDHDHDGKYGKERAFVSAVLHILGKEI